MHAPRGIILVKLLIPIKRTCGDALTLEAMWDVIYKTIPNMSQTLYGQSIPIERFDIDRRLR